MSDRRAGGRVPFLLLPLLIPAVLLAGPMMEVGAGVHERKLELEMTLPVERVVGSRSVAARGSGERSAWPARPIGSAPDRGGGGDRRPVRWLEIAALDTIPRPEPEAARVDSVPTGASRALAAQDPERFDEGLFELRGVDVPGSRTVLVLVDEAGRPLLPLTVILHFLEIPHRQELEQLLLDWPPPTWRGRVGLSDRSLHLAGSTSIIAQAEWARRPDELFVGVEVVQRILDADVHLDWENLRIVIAARGDFPIALRIANEARRGRLLGRSGLLHQRDDHTIGYPSRSGGFAAGWHFAVGGGAGALQTTTRATLGAAVLGGSLRVGSGVTTLGEKSAGLSPPFLQYSRGFSRDAPLRQLRLGEVLSEGLVGRSMHGITISNDPFYTPEYFDQVMIEPVVPAGWEYEVYQGNQLLGVSARGEGAPVPTHIRYGTNPLRIRMIGPAGQERVQELVYLIPAMQVPGGEWRYRVGAGRCRDVSCSLLAYGDLRHGLSERSTVGLGMEAATRADTSGWLRPYAIASYSPRPDLRLETRGQWGSLLHTSIQRYGMLGGWQISAGWRGEEDGVTVPASSHWYADGVAAIPLRWTRHPLITSTRLRARQVGTPEAWSTALGTVLGGVHLRAGYEHGFQVDDVVSLHASRRIPGMRHQILRDLTASTEVDATANGLRHLNVGVTTRPVDHSTLTTSLRWVGGSAVPQLAVSLVTRTPAAYLQTVANRGLHAGSWFASASGGLAYDREVGAVATPIDALGQTGIAGRVFVDLDGDGEMGKDEDALAGVSVAIGGARVSTDESGSYRYWGVLPHLVVSVGVDTIAFTRPDLAPAGPAGSVRAVPNIFTQVNIPVVPTRELVGSIAWADGRSFTTGGVTVEARLEGADVVERVLTFSDGEFYFSRLRPGRYALRIAASSLAALGAEMLDGEIELVLEAQATSGPATAPPLLIARLAEEWRERGN